MRNTYNENAQSNFAKAYLAALQAIIRFNEDLAGARLNKARDIMEPCVKGGFLPTNATTAERAIFIELRNNRIMERGVLYGDLKSTSKSPWIKDPVFLGMIKQHVSLLGNDDDQEKLKIFLDKTVELYGSKARPASPATRVLALVG